MADTTRRAVFIKDLILDLAIQRGISSPFAISIEPNPLVRKWGSWAMRSIVFGFRPSRYAQGEDNDRRAERTLHPTGLALIDVPATVCWPSACLLPA